MEGLQMNYIEQCLFNLSNGGTCSRFVHSNLGKNYFSC